MKQIWNMDNNTKNINMEDTEINKDNKYFKWYWNICERAKDRILESSIYTEKHHIYPKSIYGKDGELVKLTAKEHYIAHLLLWQGFRYKYGTKDKRTRSMAHAFTMMNAKSNTHSNLRYDAKSYSLLRQAYIEAIKGIHFTEEHIKKLKVPKSEEAKKNMRKPKTKKAPPKPKEFYIERAKKNIGKKRTIEQCKTMSDAQILYNKNISEEDRLKRAKVNIGRKASDNTRKILSEQRSGKHNSMYGKNFYDIWVEKYGQEVANDMEYNRKEKRKLNYMKKTKEELDIIENKRIETRRKNKELMNENR